MWRGCLPLFRAWLLLLLVPGLTVAARSISVGVTQQLLEAGGLQYTVTVNGRAWLHGAGVELSCNGSHYSASDGSLQLVRSASSSGSDAVGSFNLTVYAWKAANASTRFDTAIRVYGALPAWQGGLVLFEQRWPDGCTTAGAGSTESLASAFPVFNLSYHSDVQDQGYYQYMSDWERGSRPGVWNRRGAALPSLVAAESGGPIIVFDEEQLASVLSPSSRFMEAALLLSGQSLSLGVMDSYHQLPAGWTLEHMLYVEANGVGSMMEHWVSLPRTGDLLLSRYNKTRPPMYDPLVTRYLGYASDNGAYYYYNPLNNGSYSATFLAVKRYAESEHIPYRHFELDSFWYYKAAGGGVLNWTATPAAFPEGLVRFQQELRLPIMAHNRWWAPNPSYARQFGGQYEFVVERGGSVPVDQRFWIDLFRNSSQWGLQVYLQDWLGSEFNNVQALHSEVGLARTWLLQMGRGAAANGMTIQYCSPMIRHLLQSVEVEAVRQSRASADYEPGNEKWHNYDIRFTSLLLWALGIAPHKDTWWSSSEQPGNKYPVGYEPEPELQSVIATLSTGPVLPGDAIGRSNVTLLNMSCRADGLLLKPDRPAFPLDSDFVGLALDPQYNATVGYGSATFSRHGDYTAVMRLRVGQGDCNHSGRATAPLSSSSQSRLHSVRQLYSELHLGPVADQHAVTFRYSSSLLAAARRHRLLLPSLSLVGADDVLADPWSLSVPACGFVFSAASPCWAGLCVVGEVDKWVGMSRQRVSGFVHDHSGANVSMRGSEGETVHVGYVQSGELHVANCTFDASARLTIDWRLDAAPHYTCVSHTDNDNDAAIPRAARIESQ